MISRVAVAPGALSPFATYAPALVWVSLLVLGSLVQVTATRQLTFAVVAGMLLTTAAQLGAAMMFFTLLRKDRRVRRAAFVLAAGAILFAPLLIPDDARVLRFVTACASVITTMKLWDLHIHVSRGGSVDWPRFLPFLCDGFSVVLRKRGEEKRPPRQKVLADLAWGMTGSILGGAAIFTFHLVNWRDYPLLVEHAVKALVLFVAVLSWATAAIAAVRFSGGTMLDFSEAPLLARTPADFWRRYNLVFRQYFDENVFKPAGGRRSPAAVILLIFLLSALIHEYVFGLAIGRIQGFQTAFFLVQGIAVAATARIRPRRRAPVIIWTSATILFNLLTSMLFFLSFHAIAPLYENPLPAMLQR